MALKCKAGDLALVIHDEESCQSNIGRLVHVRGPVQFSGYYGMSCWLIKPLHPASWAVVESGQSVRMRRIGWSSRIDHPDEWLLPVRPDVTDLGSVESILQSLLEDLIVKAGLPKKVIVPATQPEIIRQAT